MRRTAVWSAAAVAALLVAIALLARADSSGSSSDATAGRTLFGATVPREQGETYARAIDRTSQLLGGLPVVRLYYDGPPAQWPGNAPGRNVVVSFKLPPAQVLAGRFDQRMQAWFADAPRRLHVYWVYWHEPEDEIEGGKFTARQFRAAFAHLASLARDVDSQRLHSTLVLMSYSTRSDSGRDWRDYYPGDGAVDVLAWDVYNRVPDGYSKPADLLGAPWRAAESRGKPFAVAELGSPLAQGDDGSGRAAWLRGVGRYLEDRDAAFATYFNAYWPEADADYRLTDVPSAQAWANLARS